MNERLYIIAMKQYKPVLNLEQCTCRRGNYANQIHEPTQIVEVMLTHAEQADEAVKQQLKELYAQYKGTKYTVATCCCSIVAALPSGQCRIARRQGSECGQAEEVPLPPLPNFLPLAMVNELMYNIIYKDIFGCRYMAMQMLLPF